MCSSNSRPVKSSGFPGFRERSNVTTAVRSRSNVFSASLLLGAVKTSYSASRADRIYSRMFSSSSTTRTFAFTDVSSFPYFPQALVVRCPLPNVTSSQKRSTGSMYFQNQRKILRSNEAVNSQNWRANTMPLSLSFLSGRASMERQKNSYLVGHGLPNHASGYE